MKIWYKNRFVRNIHPWKWPGRNVLVRSVLGRNVHGQNVLHLVWFSILAPIAVAIVIHYTVWAAVDLKFVITPIQADIASLFAWLLKWFSLCWIEVYINWNDTPHDDGSDKITLVQRELYKHKHPLFTKQRQKVLKHSWHQNKSLPAHYHHSHNLSIEVTFIYWRKFLWNEWKFCYSFVQEMVNSNMTAM